jgi:hypothetical protein
MNYILGFLHKRKDGEPYTLVVQAVAEIDLSIGCFGVAARTDAHVF